MCPRDEAWKQHDIYDGLDLSAEDPIILVGSRIITNALAIYHRAVASLTGTFGLSRFDTVASSRARIRRVAPLRLLMRCGSRRACAMLNEGRSLRVVGKSMRCSKCGSENPKKRFCGHCGAPLMNICQKCAADNPPDRPFCGDCGAALAGNDPATPSSASPQSTSGIQITAGTIGA
jgi:hypothetical protein